MEDALGAYNSLWCILLSGEVWVDGYSIGCFFGIIYWLPCIYKDDHWTFMKIAEWIGMALLHIMWLFLVLEVFAWAAMRLIALFLVYAPIGCRWHFLIIQSWLGSWGFSEGYHFILFGVDRSGIIRVVLHECHDSLCRFNKLTACAFTLGCKLERCKILG